ncbi:MAG TPA: helix-hairpin-helix domain-containing protein, partial [Myxococcota bacterium]|nr:helix-hairpin-helix domain-containing protein [Myxococcota bacterium]
MEKPRLLPGGTPAGTERLSGELLGFTYKADAGGFAVARLALPDDSVVAVVGVLAHLQPGQQVQLTGAWESSARFGRQLRVDSVLVEDPRTRFGLERYLSNAVDGIGPELAHRIVERFGLETLQILREDPERLLEVPGISKKKLEKISIKREELESAQQLEVSLRAFGLTSSQVRKVAERFGKDAPAVVIRSPYRLTELRGIGFRTADAIARANGVDLEDPARVGAAIRYVLEQAEEEGSCYL